MKIMNVLLKDGDNECVVDESDKVGEKLQFITALYFESILTR